MPSSAPAQSRSSVSAQMKASFNITCFTTVCARCWVEGRVWFNQKAANLRGKMPWVITPGDTWVLYVSGKAGIFLLFWNLMQFQNNIFCHRTTKFRIHRGSKEAYNQNQHFPLWMFLSTWRKLGWASKILLNSRGCLVTICPGLPGDRLNSM